MSNGVRAGMRAHVRGRRTVETTYGAAVVEIPLTDNRNDVYSASPITDERPLLGMFRKVAVQLIPVTSGVLTLQCSLDGTNWAAVPEDACNNDNATKNELAAGGGILIAELAVPMFFRVRIAAVASPDYVVKYVLYGHGEVAGTSVARLASP